MHWTTLLWYPFLKFQWGWGTHSAMRWRELLLLKSSGLISFGWRKYGTKCRDWDKVRFNGVVISCQIGQKFLLNHSAIGGGSLEQMLPNKTVTVWACFTFSFEEIRGGTYWLWTNGSSPLSKQTSLFAWILFALKTTSIWQYMVANNYALFLLRSLWLEHWGPRNPNGKTKGHLEEQMSASEVCSINF